jgi:hypothetical protein
MRSARIAEWILALVTTEDRAAAVVGDLTEVRRGSLWFWWSVFATASSIAWREVRTEPWTMVWLALSGYFGGFVCIVAIGILSGGHSSSAYPAVSIWTAGPWLTPLQYWVVFLAAHWTARRAAGREMATLLALVAVDAILTFAPPALIHAYPLGPPLNYPLTLACYFAGAIWARRRPRLLSSN